MARPNQYDIPVLLDAALELAAIGGPSAVTMTAVAKAVGSPSGSIYYRFPDRPALLSALWLRTLEGFQQGYLAALTSDEDPLTAGLAAARHIVTWSRDHPREAGVLRYGAADFHLHKWPAEARRALDEANGRWDPLFRELAQGLGAADPIAVERVMVALVEVPYALVQRHIRDGTPIPAHAAEMAEECARAVLSGVGVPPAR